MCSTTRLSRRIIYSALALLGFPFTTPKQKKTTHTSYCILCVYINIIKILHTLYYYVYNNMMNITSVYDCARERIRDCFGAINGTEKYI